MCTQETSVAEATDSHISVAVISNEYPALNSYPTNVAHTWKMGYPSIHFVHTFSINGGSPMFLKGRLERPLSSHMSVPPPKPPASTWGEEQQASLPYMGICKECMNGVR